MTIHILLNISWIKDSLTLKFDQLIKYNKRTIFSFKNHTENETGILIPDLFLCFKKALYKSKWPAAWFHYILIALNLACNKNKLYKTLYYWSRDILNSLEKSLGIVSLPNFMCDFSTKMFLMLYSINWPNFIVWLLLFLDILGNMCTAIVC